MPALDDLKKNLLTDESKATTTIFDGIKRKVNNVNYIVDEFIFSHTSQAVLNNSTIQALVLVKILNVIDDSYGNAFGINKKSVSNNDNGMSNMMNMSSMPHAATIMPDNNNTNNESSMNMMMMKMMSNNNSSGSSHSTVISNANNNTNNNNGIARKGSDDIVSIVDYQTAQALAIRAQELFNAIRLKQNALSSNSTTISAILALDKGPQSIKDVNR